LNEIEREARTSVNVYRSDLPRFQQVLASIRADFVIQHGNHGIGRGRYANLPTQQDAFRELLNVYEKTKGISMEARR